MIDKNRLCSLAKENGIILDDTALDRFDTYAELLVEWNGKMNLTAITEPEEIEVKHFLDCLMLQSISTLIISKRLLMWVQVQAFRAFHYSSISLICV